MRFLVIATICAVPIFGADEPSPEKSFVDQLFGPATFVRAGVGAAFSEMTNRPSEWGRGADGLGKRLASSYGRHLVSTTVQVGVATHLHEDLRYFPADEKGFGGRLRHALLSTVMARNKDTGGQTLAAGRISGAFASGFVSRLWFPERYHTVSSGMASGGISLGIDAGANVFREFWPKRRRSKDNTNDTR